MDIGTVIKERRAILGISQQDLSDYSGVGISTVAENGRYPPTQNGDIRSLFMLFTLLAMQN